MNKHIAIFGPTGYIGTKVIIELYNKGYKLTLFTRNLRKLLYMQDDCELLMPKQSGICLMETEIKQANYEEIKNALEGVDAIYYLIHSLNISNGNFINQDNEMAELISSAAKEAHVEQIIYLGGLGVDNPDHPLSDHLKSRHETGEHLRKYHQNVTEFRAGVIIGEGSASFELIRALSVKLPFIPQLGKDEGYCQPIFVNDVIEYLLYALLNQKYYGKIAEIGCDEVYHYSDIVKIYAEVVNHKYLKSFTIPFANIILHPYIISWFASRMSGMPYILVYRLIEGAFCDAIVYDFPINNIDPNVPIKPLSFKESLRIAAKRSEEGYIHSIWSIPFEQSVLNSKTKKQFYKLSSQEVDGLIHDEFSITINAKDMDKVFNRIKSIGGKNGYYSTQWLWKVRGFIDTLMGGPGLNNCVRRNPKLLRVGDHIDFWIVTYYKNAPNHKVLRLKANMKTPGNAWLQFSIDRIKGDSKAVVSMRPYFDPSGIFGYIYWYSLYPIHKIIFNQMIRNIVK